VRTDVDVFEVELGGESLVVVSLPIGPFALYDTLTRAEVAVAQDAAAGLSNAAIAKKRGSSARTVANQLASVYRKLGFSSRAELAAKLHGGT
jgi:DNA-binding NarL/FixJ family response regulator